MSIRVLIVDDQQLVRAGLRMLCEVAGDMRVVGEAADGVEAVRLALRELPDVVLMDLRMPRMDGIDATARILAERPGMRVVALTTFDDDDHLYPVLEAGACGFLVKDASPEELLAGIRRAAAGDRPFTPDVLRRLVAAALTTRDGGGKDGGGNADGPGFPELTRREADVLALVSDGLSNAEIAERLHVGITTVKTHVTNLMAKTGAANRVRLAVYGLRRS